MFKVFIIKKKEDKDDVIQYYYETETFPIDEETSGIIEIKKEFLDLKIDENRRNMFIFDQFKNKTVKIIKPCKNCTLTEDQYDIVGFFAAQYIHEEYEKENKIPNEILIISKSALDEIEKKDKELFERLIKQDVVSKDQ